ncbi:MAG: phosphoglycerate kinase [Thaumarchaeota archaeon]|nr:phosphoglycerate kinase [Nitrososphaerota archaeon]
MKALTLDDFDLRGKTIYLRVDMNCPMDPRTMEISSTRRIEEVSPTLDDMRESKVVLASHQGRVGNSDYTGMDRHAAALERFLGRRVKYVEDVIGSAAQDAIKSMRNGDILLLDNLRLCAEENYEFPPADAANTMMVRRLAGLFDLCVLDSFPSAHRAHPSIVGFPQSIPACVGRMAEREVRNLDEIVTVAKAPHVVVLGGAKVPDRIESIRMLIRNGRADSILLTGIIGNVFMRAQSRIRYPLGIRNEDDMVRTAHDLLGEYPDVFFTPVDVAVESGGERLELDVRNLTSGDHIYDIGTKTVDHYSRIIASAGTAFISGPAGYFEREGYEVGTRRLLEAVAGSMATTIVSGGHLTSALKRYGLDTHINHISTAGGALVRYLAGVKLPMIRALEDAAARLAGPQRLQS